MNHLYRTLRPFHQLTRLGVTALVLCTGGVRAAESDVDAINAKYGVLEEVVSTARKRSEPLQDTPVASTVLSGETLDMRFYADLKTAEFPAPNVNITSIGAFSNGVVATIRGIVNGDPDSTIEPPVALFVDGVYLARPAASSLDMFDIEQIEILRGPQGTLFGRNTSAGAIQLRTARPSGEFGTLGKVTAGEYGRLDLRAAVDIPIAETVNARIAVLSQNMDGYYKSITNGKDFGKEEILSVRPTIQFTPTEQLDLTFIGEFHHDKSEPKPQQNESTRTQALCVRHGYCGFALGDGDEFEVETDDVGFIDAKIWGVTAELNYRLDSGVITWISNYRDTDEDLVYDADSVLYPLFGVDRRQPHKQYSSELRFASTAWEKFDFVAGAFVFHQEYDLQRITSLAIVAPPPARTISFTGQDHDAYSIFGEVNYHITDALTVTAGGRYTDEKKDFYQRPFGPFPNAGARVDQDESWSDFGPKLGVQYNFTDDLMTYFTYQKGFKSGGFNGRCGQPATCLKSFDPEEVDAFEVGLKADFFDQRARANLALFWSEYTDLQRTTFVPLIGAANPQETVTENAGDATIKGIELELTMLPVEGLQLNLAVGYLHTKYDEFCADINGATLFASAPVSNCGGAVVQATNLGNPGGPATYLVDEDNSNLPFTRAPEWNVSVTANYRYPLANGASIFVNGQYTWIDKLFVDAVALTEREEVKLVEASISYEAVDGRYRVSVFGKNLTDEVYLESRTNVPGLFATRVVNQPRRWGVEFAWNL